MMGEAEIAEKKSKSGNRFCGNCHHHDVYEYPDLILCGLRYPTRNDFIVSTLGCCEKWKLNLQECFCVGEALKKHGRKSIESSKDKFEPSTKRAR